jgi:hypothetical protein
MTSYVLEAESAEEAVERAKQQGSDAGSGFGPVDLWSALPISDDEPYWLPKGWGVYCRRIQGGVPEAQDLVRRCQQASVQWVGLMVEATDGFKVSLETTRTYAEVLQGAGIETVVWTFPGEARAASVQESRDAANLALTYAETIGAAAVLLDIEAPYKGKPEELRTLIETADFGLPEGATLGIVSYPVLSWHPTLDTSSFSLAQWGSPMLYESAQDPKLIARANTEWSALVDTLAPSLWTNGNLAQDIERVFGSTSTPSYQGGPIWSEQSLTTLDRGVLTNASEKYGWT